MNCAEIQNRELDCIRASGSVVRSFRCCGVGPEFACIDSLCKGINHLIVAVIVGIDQRRVLRIAICDLRVFHHAGDGERLIKRVALQELGLQHAEFEVGLCLVDGSADGEGIRRRAVLEYELLCIFSGERYRDGDCFAIPGFGRIKDSRDRAASSVFKLKRKISGLIGSTEIGHREIRRSVVILLYLCIVDAHRPLEDRPRICGNKIQYLVAPVRYLSIRIVRGEVCGVILLIGVGERHRVACISDSHADGCAGLHGSRNGQRLAGGQIDVICRTGDGVVSHSGRTAELQLTGILGIDINSAAAARRVVFNRTAGEIADRAGAVNIDAAAVARGGISADNAAGHIQYGRFAVKVDCTAIHRRVPGDFAAGEVKRGCAVHMHRAALAGRLIAADFAAGHGCRYAIVEIDRAAVLAGCIAGELCAGDGDRTACHVDDAAVAVRGLIARDRAAGQIDRAAAFGIDHAAFLRCVVGDRAAVHVHGATLVVCLVQEDRAAGLVAVVAGNFAAVDVQHTLAVIQRDGAAALSGDLTAGDRTAEDIQGTLVEIHAAAAPDALGRAFDRAASGAVAEDEPSAVFDYDLIRAVAGEGVSAQAEVERCAVHHQIAVDGDILRQIHISGFIGVRNGVCAVPCRERLGGVRGMIPCRSVAAADAVLVEECPVGVERMRLAGGHNCGFLHLRAAVFLGEPAVEAVVRARWRRQRAVGRAGLNEFALFARVQCTAVGVEGDLDRRNGAAQVQIIVFAILLYLQLPVIRVVAEEAVEVRLRPRFRIDVQIIQKDRRAVAGDAGEVNAEFYVCVRVYVDGKLDLRVRIAEIEVVLGGIDRVVIDIRSDRAAASIHVAHIYYLFRRKRHQIEAAARFSGGIAGDAAVPVTDEADADIRAAAPLGRVAGDRAAVELAATGILAVEVAAVNAAARFGGYVVLNLAAVEMELCAGGGVDTAAVVGGPVIRDHAAVDRDRPGSGMDTAAGRGGVAGDRAALHREAGIASRDGHSAAVSGDGVAGQCAAVERGVCICADTDAAAAGIGAAEPTCANAVAQIQFRRLALRARQRDGRLGRIGAGKAVAVQAQIQDVLRRNCQIYRYIVGQIDISNITALFSVFADLNPFLFVFNFALAVPCLPFHVLVGVIERTAADAVLVVVCPVGVERMIVKFRHDSGCVHLRAADRRSVPAVKVVAVARRRRQCAVSIAGHNRFALLVFVQRTAVGVEGHGMSSPGLFHGENQRRGYGELIHRCPREGQRIGSGR